MANGTRVIDAKLPDGGTVSVRATDLGGASDVGALDNLPFETVTDTIRQVGQSVVGAIKDVAPKTATVEFGVEVAVRAGKLVSLLADADGRATFTVTLEWGG